MLGANRGTSKSGKDYRKYRMNMKDLAVCTMLAATLAIAVAWLFYRSIWGLTVYPLLWLVVFLRRKREGIKNQQHLLREQFKECIRVVAASMYSGYSVENAFAEAEKELLQLLGDQSDMCRELRSMNLQIRLNVPVESLMQELAGRSGVEEISGFGQVFGYAKRSGSDFSRILKDTSDRIGEKIELERELRMLVAAKQLEQRIMNVIPMGILLFVEITSPGFLQIMYTGVFGRAAMTICLLVYGGTYLLSGKIVDIKI